MNRFTRTFVCFSLFCPIGLLVAADAPKFSSKNAQQAVAKYRLAIERAKEDYDKALAAAQAEYLDGLKAAMTEETKKGNLDGAVEIRDAIKAADAKSSDGPNIIERLKGTVWANSRGKMFRWDEDGTFTNDGNPWICVPVDENRVAIVYENDKVQVLQFDKKLAKFEGWGWGGKGKPEMTGSRVPAKNSKKSKSGRGKE